MNHGPPRSEKSRRPRIPGTAYHFVSTTVVIMMNQVRAILALCLAACVSGFVVQSPAAFSRGQFVSRASTSQVCTHMPMSFCHEVRSAAFAMGRHPTPPDQAAARRAASRLVLMLAAIVARSALPSRMAGCSEKRGIQSASG